MSKMSIQLRQKAYTDSVPSTGKFYIIYSYFPRKKSKKATPFGMGMTEEEEDTTLTRHSRNQKRERL